MVASTANSLMIAMISSCRGDKGRELISSTIARAARSAPRPVVISITVRTFPFDNELPNSHADDLVL
jgi:hypothetical protein